MIPLDICLIWEVNMKRIISIICCFFLIISSQQINVYSEDEESNVWSGKIADNYDGGNGTEGNPYLIRTAEQLAYLKKMVDDGNNYDNNFFKLTDDIYLNDVSDFEKWSYQEAPKNKWEGINDFAGNIDGNYHSIYGLYNVGKENVGFFNKIENNKKATDHKFKTSIYNLDFKDCYVYGTENVAIIVGNADYLWIDNCNVYGKVYVSKNYGSGILGYFSSGGCRGIQITNSNNYSVIDGSSYLGGILGYGHIGNGGGYDTSGNGNEKIIINNCINYGEIKGNSYVGGLIGETGVNLNCSGVEINNLANEGNVTADGNYIGGIAGYVATSYGMSIKGNNFYNKASINSNGNYIGGIYGYAQPDLSSGIISIDDSYNIGNVIGVNYVGGILGAGCSSWYGKTSVSKCINIGQIKSKSGMGYGISGGALNASSWFDGSHMVENCYIYTGTSDKKTAGTSIKNVEYLTNDQLKNKESFGSFDFDQVWIMGSSYPILKWVNNYTIEVPDFDKNTDKTVDDYIINEVKKYTSDQVYAQYESIMNSNASYEEKHRRLVSLFGKNYGITDINEGRKYLSSTTSERYAYLFLTTNESFCASGYANWIDNNPSKKALLYADGLIFNSELSSYTDITTYIKNETPGIKKCKTMLKSFMASEDKSFVGSVFKNANRAAKDLKNIIKLNDIYLDATLDKEVRKLMNASSNDEINDLNEDILEKIVKQINNKGEDVIYIDNRAFLKVLGYSATAIKLVNNTYDDVLDIINLQNQVSLYKEYADFLETLSTSTEISLDMRIAAKQLKNEIDNGYFSKIRSLIGNVFEFVDGVGILDKEKIKNFLKENGFNPLDKLTTALKDLELATFISNIVIDMGDFVKQTAYTQGYAEISNLYSKKLMEDKRKFIANNLAENAWSFFEDYTMLWDLRYKGEEQYLKMSSVKMLLIASVKTLDYDIKVEVVNDTLDRLAKAKFQLSPEFIIPTSKEYVKKSIIQCPVDVEIYTKSGEFVAKLEDTVENDIENEHGRFLVVYDSYSKEYIKVICQSLDEELQYKIIAKDDGLVDYSYFDKNQLNTFDKLAIRKNDIIFVESNKYTKENANGEVSEEGKFIKKSTESYKKITNAVVDKDNIQLVSGKKHVVKVKIDPIDANNTAIDWFSMNDEIASIKNGIIYAHKRGKTTVFANVIDSKICIPIEVNVVEKTATGIKVTPPSKVEYVEGQELELTGGSVEITYNDGTTKTKDLTEEMISGFDKEKLGEQEIKVKYGNQEATFKINVVKNLQVVDEKINPSDSKENNTSINSKKQIKKDKKGRVDTSDHNMLISYLVLSLFSLLIIVNTIKKMTKQNKCK